jgi:acyl-coenzyme A thioesterase PaaI-like protein
MSAAETPPASADPTPPPGYRRTNWRTGFGTHAGPIYEKREPGGATYARAFHVEDRHTNGMGNAHGGMLLTFADMAFGHAVSVADNQWWVTVRLSCDFLAPAHVGEWVEGSADILWKEGSLYTVRGRVWVGERTVLTGTGVFKAVAPRS